ncbi:MAG: hypothetical protein ACRDCE_00900 [Cetobacterium sp.]|uniref:hypothetical protein n=1 Tax=Cetobacterium sp. TaxID=2071632 RepID=UPI003EE60347
MKNLNMNNKKITEALQAAVATVTMDCKTATTNDGITVNITFDNGAGINVTKEDVKKYSSLEYIFYECLNKYNEIVDLATDKLLNNEEITEQEYQAMLPTIKEQGYKWKITTERGITVVHDDEVKDIIVKHNEGLYTTQVELVQPQDEATQELAAINAIPKLTFVNIKALKAFEHVRTFTKVYGWEKQKVLVAKEVAITNIFDRFALTANKDTVLTYSYRVGVLYLYDNGVVINGLEIKENASVKKFIEIKYQETLIELNKRAKKQAEDMDFFKLLDELNEYEDMADTYKEIAIIRDTKSVIETIICVDKAISHLELIRLLAKSVHFYDSTMFDWVIDNHDKNDFRESLMIILNTRMLNVREFYKKQK